MFTTFVLPALASCLMAPPCTCVPGPHLSSEAAAYAARNAASAVFEGVVQHIDFVEDTIAVGTATGRAWRSMDAIVTLRVRRSWKGAFDRTVTVRTPAQTTMCGASLSKGRIYLVFGQSSDSDGRGGTMPVQRGDTVFTSKCTSTTGVNSQIERIGELLGQPELRIPEA